MSSKNYLKVQCPDDEGVLMKFHSIRKIVRKRDRKEPDGTIHTWLEDEIAVRYQCPACGMNYRATLAGFKLDSVSDDLF